MLGDEAYQLAKEAKRITVENLTPYNRQQVSLITRQTRQLWKKVEEYLAIVGERHKDIDLNNLSSNLDSSSLFSSNYLDSSQKNNFESTFEGSSFIGNAESVKAGAGNDIYGHGMVSSDNSSSVGAVNGGQNKNMSSIMSILVLNHLTVHRNKRILMAYHKRREEVLMKISWAINLNPSMLLPASGAEHEGMEVDSGITGHSDPDKLKDPGRDNRLSVAISEKISHVERQFIQDYTTAVKQYKDSVEKELGYFTLDWTSSLEKPPVELFIEVRVLRECGEIMTEFGVINLQENSQHYVRRSDVETLINLGYLMHIS
ncbi:DNA replication complex GINS protein PSF1 [Zancudomyces culisetae]|uniref:DNA replication complex GINS protein PSF1 n=1 Tax=Zancudomyces culisetae TaxID=1213189 RepID=A0A1R1PWH2_ZANCU|nr:DNA replication complex GINS protein PSF1 [Zancudomyces culisetae]|eukprot:OMH85320.1 DNA replication complex GINS protein PSF1 [Zancudomyces culisetae]